jgi:hypothetical protein
VYLVRNRAHIFICTLRFFSVNYTAICLFVGEATLPVFVDFIRILEVVTVVVIKLLLARRPIYDQLYSVALGLGDRNDMVLDLAFGVRVGVGQSKRWLIATDF